MKFITLLIASLLLTCSATFSQIPVPPSVNGQFTFAQMLSWKNLTYPLHNYIDSITATGDFYLFQKEPRAGHVSFSYALAAAGTYTALPSVKAWVEVTNDTGRIWSILPSGISSNVTTTTVTTLNSTVATSSTVYTDTFTFTDTSRNIIGHSCTVNSGNYARYRIHFKTATLPTGMILLPSGIYAWKPED